MALTLEQFADQLSSSGLVSADDIAQLRQQLAPADAEQFAKVLVKQKVLTAYQAQQVYAGKGKTLVLGNYVLLDKLGQGGMGMVLKAQHRRMKRTVALKVLSPAVAKSPELIARFHREVEAAARLTHPNIVAAFDADEAGGTSFLVMEFVDGKDLASVVKSQGPLSVGQTCRCLIQAAKGLEYAHNQKIVHRDIKPANLLIDRQGTVKILDMGLARMDAESGKTELTSTGAVMGTVDYMAPEQALSTKHADARSDIYSLGITLWYLLTGKAAYDGDSMMARLLGHRDAPIPSLVTELANRPAGAKAIAPQQAAAIDAIFRKMVAKRPEDRYQSMAEVVAALEGLSVADSSTVGLTAVSVENSAALSTAGATSARQPTRAVRSGGSATKTQDEDLVPGSPFAATVNTSNEETPTDAGPATRTKGRTALPPKVAKGGKGARKPPAKGNNRFWLMAGGGAAALIVLGVIVITITGKDGAQTKIEVPADSKVEITTKSSETKPADLQTPISIPKTPVSTAPLKTESGWTTLAGTELNAAEWKDLGPFRFENGELAADKTGFATVAGEYIDFDLEFDWKVTEKSNGGLYYHSDPAATAASIELQLLDDQGVTGVTALNGTGSLWGVIPASRNASKLVGEWNSGRVFSEAGRVEHWINGEKVAEYDRNASQFKDTVAKLSNAQLKQAVSQPKGTIKLQSQGRIAFRNMRIRRLGGAPVADELITTEESSTRRWQKLGPFSFRSGELQADKSGLAVSAEQYDDFDLEFEWKIAPGGNSGVYYRSDASKTGTIGSYPGTEFQLLDGSMHADGKSSKTTSGSLYGVVAVSRDVSKPAGEWNTARIVARGPRVEHWLNGEKVVEYDLDSPEFQEVLKSAKNDQIRANVVSRKGNILLQGHTGLVSLRNMRIWRLEPAVVAAVSEPSNLLHPNCLIELLQKNPSRATFTGSSLVLDDLGTPANSVLAFHGRDPYWRRDQTVLKLVAQELSPGDDSATLSFGFGSQPGMLNVLLKGKRGSRVWALETCQDWRVPTSYQRLAQVPAREFPDGRRELELRLAGSSAELLENGQRILNADSIGFEPKHSVLSVHRSKWLVERFTAQSSSRAVAKASMNLIASLDLNNDRVQAGNLVGKNDWKIDGDTLTFTTDGGKSGKVMFPISLNDVRRYTIEGEVKRLSGSGPFTFDLPGNGSLQTGLDLIIGGNVQLVVADKKRSTIGQWPNPSSGGSGFRIDVDHRADGSGSVRVQVDGKDAAAWDGPIATTGRPLEFHPQFSGERLLSLFCFKDSFEFKSLSLTVRDGNARPLRVSAAPSAVASGASGATSAATSAASNNDAR